MAHKAVKGLVGLAIIGLAGVALWKLAEDGAFNSILPSGDTGGLFGHGNVIPSNAYQVNVAT